MGELNPEHIVVTAFLSEGCDPCVSQRSTIEQFADLYPEYPVFISHDETMMDNFEIEITPCVMVMDITTGDYATSEGEVSYTQLEDINNEFRQGPSD